MTAKLNVNIDHVATVREARKTIEPSVVAAAVICEQAGADGMTGLVAVDGADVPVGLANLVFHRSTWSPTWYCYLEDLYVDPGVRGSGVGRALIEAAYAEADRRGASRTYWATQEHNATARKLYDDIGVLTEFVQYRR